jgi:hypothetical protein
MKTPKSQLKICIITALKNRSPKIVLRTISFLLVLLCCSQMSFAGAITIDVTPLPDGTVGQAYSATFSLAAGSDMVTPVTWAINAADLPGLNAAGLVFNAATHSISTTGNGMGNVLPAAANVIFRVQVINQDNSGSDEHQFTLHIVTNGNGDGDPHITTADGIHYDFQGAGEFVFLRGDSGSNLEIQNRQIPVATNSSVANSYTGLTTCVSLNTAVAARVGTHRVTYEPNIDGRRDSSGMQLRVDGSLISLGDSGVDLGSGGRIVKLSAGTGIEIDFPDGTYLIVTSNWWSYYSVWYLNIDVYHTTDTRGIMGTIAPGSWLPKLPDGKSVGPRPDGLYDHFLELYGTFANAWRVTDKTSLFDYAPGTSTATFTNKDWPVWNAESCNISEQKPPETSITLEVATQLCKDIIDSNMKANAIFDVMVTGEPQFVKAYLLTQQIQATTSATKVNANKDTTKLGEPVTFTATVFQKFLAGKEAFSGSVEFMADGEKLGEVKLGADGNAVLTTTSLKVGNHQITATFTPDSGSKVSSSTSLNITHTVLAGDGSGGTSILHQWWLWLILIIIIIIIILVASRKKTP